jgi:hypothetical protein
MILIGKSVFSSNFRISMFLFSNSRLTRNEQEKIPLGMIYRLNKGQYQLELKISL